jgi:hypothetical protein
MIKINIPLSRKKLFFNLNQLKKINKMKKTTILLSATLLAMNFAKAQDTTKVEEKKSPFTVSGYIDSYYFYNLNNPLSGSNLGQSGVERIFDQRSNTIGLGLVQTKLGYSNDKSDVVVDLAFGPNGDLGNYGNAIGPLGAGIGTTSLAIKQAYFNYKATEKLTFTAGQFGTHVGYEVIDAPVNFNYSLSNLFGNGPFYHIGVKANYAFTDRFALMAGVVNNIDGLYDNNASKGMIAQMFIKPAENWNVYINYMNSNEMALDSTGKYQSGLYQIVDLTTGYQLTEKFYMGVNAAYGEEYMPGTTLNWGGAALYTNFAFTDKFALGARAEYFDNTSGVRLLRNPNTPTGGTDVTSITATANITLADGHLLLKPEFRIDTFKKLDYDGSVATGTGLGDAGDIQQFMDANGNWTKNAQSTVGMAMIYKF